jgi:hypothetical protein
LLEAIADFRKSIATRRVRARSGTQVRGRTARHGRCSYGAAGESKRSRWERSCAYEVAQESRLWRRALRHYRPHRHTPIGESTDDTMHMRNVVRGQGATIGVRGETPRSRCDAGTVVPTDARLSIHQSVSGGVECVAQATQRSPSSDARARHRIHSVRMLAHPCSAFAQSRDCDWSLSHCVQLRHTSSLLIGPCFLHLFCRRFDALQTPSF